MNEQAVGVLHMTPFVSLNEIREWNQIGPSLCEHWADGNANVQLAPTGPRGPHRALVLVGSWSWCPVRQVMKALVVGRVGGGVHPGCL